MNIVDVYRRVKPNVLGLLSEIRFLPELVRYVSWSKRRQLRGLPPGDGRPILVIPGFLCNDAATWMMRRSLKRMGYRPFAWQQGINWGPGPGVRTRLLHRINLISQRCEAPVTLIGWSLGGVYARELSSIRPDLIREVITLGSPISGKPEAIGIWPIYRWLNRRHARYMSTSILDYSRPVLGRTLAVFTRGDGIVPWRNCRPVRGQTGATAEVSGSHIGLVHNPDVMTLLAHHLSSDDAAPARGEPPLSEVLLVDDAGIQLKSAPAKDTALSADREIQEAQNHAPPPLPPSGGSDALRE